MPLFCALLLSACNGGGGGGGDGGGGGSNSGAGGSASPQTYVVRGSISGLAGSGLTLRNNGSDNLALAAAATSFQFATSLADQAAYNVSVSAHPIAPSQTCTVTNGSGTINGANVTNVQISCTTNAYLIGGTVTGLTGTGLVLQLNGGNSLPVTSATPNFSFPTAVPSGSVYTVSVSSQPAAQTCGVTNGSGTLGAANVNNVIVSCTTNVSSNTYSVSANVTGLTGSGLALRLNGGSPVSIGGNGTAALGSGLGDATVYTVTVSTQPSSPSQTCTVANSSGTISGANVTVAVTCATNVYTIGGAISGLAGGGLQLQLNGADDLSIPVAASSFTFPNAIADGSVYAVTVRTQPASPSQTCAVTQLSSTVNAANVTNVQVSCTTNSFPVFVSVNGLSGAGLVLQNNSGPDLAIGGNGSFAFSNPVLSGASYQVTVATQPSSPSQVCTLTNGTGTVGNGSVTNVMVNCATNTYAVGGTVAGLTGSGLVLQLNGSTNLSISGNGGFAFNPIADASAYAVTVATHPSLQTCTVTNGTGTLAAAAVTNVAVSCSDVKWSGIKQFGSSGDDVVNAVAVDPSNGDVVVIGCYQGALSGNAKGTCDMPGGHARAYVRKYDRTGDFKWEASLGNSGNTQANGVAIDTNGDIYLTGVSQGALDGHSGNNDDDYFLAKYSSLGAKRWVGIYGGASADRGNALAFDAARDLYLVGTVYTTSHDIYIAKFSAASLASLTTPPSAPVLDTIFASAQAGSTQPNDFPFHVVTDGGFVYVSGTTLGSLNGNTNAGVEDTFVMKLSGTTLGNQWTQQIGTASYDRNGGIAVDTAGSVYVAGSTGGSLAATNSTPGVNDLFVVKYDASGVEQWRRQVVSPGHEHVTAMASGAGNTIYIAGYTNRGFNGNSNLDPSGNTTDLFLIKYDANGTPLWSRQAGTTTDDRPYAVAIDTYPGGGDHGAFVAGYTLGVLEGNSNVGGADMFVIKYDAAGILQ